MVLDKDFFGKDLRRKIEENKGWKFLEPTSGPDADPLLYTQNKKQPFFMQSTFPDLKKWLETGIASHWVAGEIDFGDDVKDLEKMTKPERQFLIRPLIFFLSSDVIVGDNLMENLKPRFPHSDIAFAFLYQGFNEVIHSMTYRTAAETLIKDPKELENAYKAIENLPAVQRKADWALKWSNDKDVSTQEQLVAWGCVEGVLFSASFASIGFLCSKGYCKGLKMGNDLINRDEATHFELSANLYDKCKNKLPEWRVHQIYCEAIEAEAHYIDWILEDPIPGMNKELMLQYAMFVADWCINRLGYKRLFNVENPFPFMTAFSIDGNRIYLLFFFSR